MSGNPFTSLQAFTARRELREGDATIMPPRRHHPGFEARKYVSHVGIDLRSTVMWHDENSDFYHEAVTGEVWNFAYHGSLSIHDVGDWDVRTPILHPAVAGVDATEAGYDDAYLRALLQVDVLTYGARDESKMTIRRMVERYCKAKYSPFRLLVRGVVLWAIASRNEFGKRNVRTTYAASDLSQPMRLSDTGGLSAIARAQYTTPSDVIYLRCESASDLGLVDVARALTARVCPVETNMKVATLWPDMASPCVVYTSITSAGMGAAAFDAPTVEEFLYRFCRQFDCFDLLELAVVQVQLFLARPKLSGVLGGASGVSIGMPPSDLRIGAIGPLLAGISAEGMRTSPYLMPSWAEFAYGGAARATFCTASYYQGLLAFDQTHPVAYTHSTYMHKGRARMLGEIPASKAMIDEYAIGHLTAAGWECWPEQLRYVAPTYYSGYERRLFDGTRTPWWTNVIGHIAPEGEYLLASWATPAHVRNFVKPGHWYTYKMLDGVTCEQVTSAVRWLGAKVSYVVATGASSTGFLPIKTAGSSRFMPILQSDIVMDGVRQAVACIQFTEKANEGFAFLRALGRCKPSVMKSVHPTEAPDAAPIILDSLTGGFPPELAPPVISEPEPDDDFDDPNSKDVRPGQPPPGPSQPADGTDWEAVTSQLRKLGVNTTASAFPAALAMDREVGNGPYSAAMQVARIKAREVERLPEGERVGMAQAVLQAATRLAPHSVEGYEELGKLQASMIRIIVEGVDKRRRGVPLDEQEQLDAEASAALEAGLATVSAVPLGHDDPEAETESVQDFGNGQSGQDLVPAGLPASSAPGHSRAETLGFHPPERSGRLGGLPVPVGPAAPPQ